MGYPETEITANEYQQLALGFENTPRFIRREHAPFGGPSDHEIARLLHAAIGVNTESGELSDQIKRAIFYGKSLDETNVFEECGDVLWYVSLALAAIGETITNCMARNIDKLRSRYPDKFDATRALMRDLPAERKALEGATEPEPDAPKGWLVEVHIIGRGRMPDEEIAALGDPGTFGDEPLVGLREKLHEQGYWAIDLFARGHTLHARVEAPSKR